MATTSTHSTSQHLKTFPLSYAQWKTAATVLLYSIISLALPGLCHLLPNGGTTWLPIYFMTLLLSWRYGYRVGLIAAILIPVTNHLLFGMPMASSLAVILIKSVLLALAASALSRRIAEVSVFAVALVVIAYQLLGGLAEWAIAGSWQVAVQDLAVGYPGLLVQIAAGWLLLRYVLHK